MTALLDRLRPCGPVVDAAAARRGRERLGGSAAVEAAWPALAPVVAASPYLAGLMAQDAARLDALLLDDPAARLEHLLQRTTQAGTPWSRKRPDARCAG